MAINVNPKEKAIVTWNKEGQTKAVALNQLYDALCKYQVPHKSNSSDVYRNVYQDGISVRDEFSRTDYDGFRPGDKKPTHPKDIIRVCNGEYKNNGIVHNVFDLMGDFATQGVELNHPVKKVEEFYRAWWKKVRGIDRTERLANLLARMGSVIITRQTAKVPLRVVTPSEQSRKSVDIPFGYTFLNPVTLEVIGEEFSAFLSNNTVRYGIKVPSELSKKIQYPTTADKDFIAQIPPDILGKIRNGDKVIPINPDILRAMHYKKDDWEVWATPMLYSILDDLQILRKMKQADLAALDGAISQIRIWKLGSLEHEIVPSTALINRLADILINSIGGGILDLIWGPDLVYQAAETNLHNFLGETKYAPTLNRIFAGLGIPPLFSGATSQGSFSNNYVAIKTLIERLNYIRSIIIEFWEYEIELVRKAMGFNKGATISFDRMTLNDESGMLKIMEGLVDRNLLSVEAMQEMVGASPEIETFRLKREKKLRDKGLLPEKLSSLPSDYQALKKGLAVTGQYSAEELGVELETPAANKRIPAKETAKQQPKPGPILPNGRPKNAKDATKRKEKKVLPRKSVKGSFIKNLAWANESQKTINDIVLPKYLESVGKANLRQLTTKEADEFEKKKFAVLCSLDPLADYEEKTIIDIFSSNQSQIPILMSEALDKAISEIRKKNEPITLDKMKLLQSYVYSMVNSDEVGVDEVQDDGI